jgi:hypothetical protein
MRRNAEDRDSNLLRVPSRGCASKRDAVMAEDAAIREDVSYSKGASTPVAAVVRRRALQKRHVIGPGDD